MTSVAEVRLWGTTVGAVARVDNDDYASFEYDTGFLRSGIELSPLMMPLARRVYSFPQLPRNSFHGLPPLLADSLPDKFGSAVLDSWFASQGRGGDSLDCVERLCYTGLRGMGALEYVPSIGPDHSPQESLHIERLVELASQILTQRESISANAHAHGMEQIIEIGTSAGGARAKAVVAWNEQTGELRSGQIEPGDGFEHWLMKFDGVSGNRDKEAADPPHYTVIEYAYHLMANAAGIDMMECRLFEEGERRHFMTRRFDRPRNGGKLHSQTLGALAGFDFNSPGAHSYEQAAEIIRRVGLGQREVEELFRRMVFNVIARNQDDHVKNISFLMDRTGSWSLAPAYDVTYAYKPDGAWTGSHQMTIHGKRDEIDLEDCLASASSMSIKMPRAKDIIAQVSDATSRWQEFASTAGLAGDTTNALAKAFVVL